MYYFYFIIDIKFQRLYSEVYCRTLYSYNTLLPIIFFSNVIYTAITKSENKG